MSLLIQALEKAEKGKAADSNSELALEPKFTSAEAEPDQTKQKVQTEANQQVAATVFTAKTEQPKKSPTLNKALVAGVVLVLILAVAGLQFYAYLNNLNAPETVAPRPQVAEVNFTPAVTASEITAEAITQDVKPDAEIPPADLATDPSQVGADEDKSKPGQTATSSTPTAEQPAIAKADGQQLLAVSSVGVAVPDKITPADVSVTRIEALQTVQGGPKTAQTLQKQTARSQQLNFGDAVPMSRDTAVKVTRNQPANGVNPNLLAAYQAFSLGDDAAAQLNYRQVLQSDVRNVDALLGMAAIAARQGRNNDAAGWYGKVLEVEPRNDVAQAAMVSVLAQADPVSSESRIKNLIAQQPEAAHLYASLGNMYAEQNQWPSAQQAYFQAFHFDQKNAEYAFNLAVSLEQLGKSALALPYYQRALALLPANGTSGIDRTQLESRIAKLR